ncbi:hypothetical protein LTS10_006278 [Elasticomyces elasticus]|nr:hypothetical protein LTS10_006278 [Elasticomyces elasticus]
MSATKWHSSGIDIIMSSEAIPGGNAVVVGEVTVQTGQAVILSGHVLGEGTPALIVDGTRTVALPRATNPLHAATTFIPGGRLLIAYAISGGDGVLIVNGVTLTRGQAKLVDGQWISNGPSGLVIGGTSTISLPNSDNIPASTVFEVSGRTYTAYGVSSRMDVEVVNGITISLGQAVTLDGHVFSNLAEVGKFLVDGTSS